jgi:general L-amino acid transport system ATP-binding protein
MEMLGGFAVALATIYGGYRVIETGATPGAFVSFLAAFLLAYEPAKRLARLNIDLNNNLVGVRVLYEIIDSPPGEPNDDNLPPLKLTAARIEFVDVDFAYREHTPVLRGMSFVAEPSQVTALVGPSGGGKSTLLRCINRLEDWQLGRVIVDGTELTDDLKRVDEIRREVGMVFQQFNLFPHLTVLENCTLAPIWVRRLPRREAEALARHNLARVRIPEQADKYPGQLSGGQQQRVAIARALCMRPKIMLFDEPTSALDPEMVREVLDSMLALALDGMTMVVVSHEMGFARQAASRMVLMDAGQIIEVNEPEAFFANPQHERTKLFLSQILK